MFELLAVFSPLLPARCARNCLKAVPYRVPEYLLDCPELPGTCWTKTPQNTDTSNMIEISPKRDLKRTLGSAALEIVSSCHILQCSFMFLQETEAPLIALILVWLKQRSCD